MTVEGYLASFLVVCGVATLSALRDRDDVKATVWTALGSGLTFLLVSRLTS